MPRQVTAYSVFIASPSDVAEERAAIREAILQWNADHSLASGAILDPLMWETHATPELSGPPQQLINQQVIDWSDFAIACFWSTPGTATANAESGTIEEIERLLDAGKTVLVYFCTRPIPQAQIPSGDFARLRDFKERCKTQGLYREFDTPSALRASILSDLSRLMNRRHGATTLVEDGTSLAEQSDDGLLAQEFSRAMRRFRMAWLTEGQSDTPNFQELKEAERELRNDVTHLSGELDESMPGGPEIISRVRAVLAMCKKVDEFMRFYGDGDEFNDILKAGNDIVEQLTRIVALLAQPSSTAAGDESVGAAASPVLQRA